MAVFLVAYDLNSPGQHHARLLELIKSFAWAKLSESAYAIDPGALSVEEALARFRSVIDANDSIYVINLRRPYSGFGPVDVNQWLDARLS